MKVVRIEVRKKPKVPNHLTYIRNGRQATEENVASRWPAAASEWAGG